MDDSSEPSWNRPFVNWNDREEVRRFYYEKRNQLREASPIHWFEPTVFTEIAERKAVSSRRVKSPHIPVSCRMLDGGSDFYLNIGSMRFSYVLLVAEVVEPLTRKNGFFDFSVKDEEGGPICVVSLNTAEQTDRYPSSETPDTLVDPGRLLRIHGLCGLDQRNHNDKKLTVVFMRPVENLNEITLHKMEIAYAKKCYLDKQMD